MKDKFSNLYIENQLCFPIYASSRLTIQAYTPYLDELGITYPQYLVLMVLWQYSEQSVGEIGARLLLESNTLTPLLKRMEQKELITRTRSKADERTVIISLTQKGKKLREKAVSIPEKIITSLQDDSITEAEALSFQKTLWKLLDVLKEKTTSA